MPKLKITIRKRASETTNTIRCVESWLISDGNAQLTLLVMETGLCESKISSSLIYQALLLKLTSPLFISERTYIQQYSNIAKWMHRSGIRNHTKKKQPQLIVPMEHWENTRVIIPRKVTFLIQFPKAMYTIYNVLSIWYYKSTSNYRLLQELVVKPQPY